MFRTFRPFLLLLVMALFGMAACNDAASPTEEVVPVEPGVLAVTSVFARPSPEAGGTGGVYLTVLNGLDQPLQLTSIDGAIAAAVELHETVAEAGVMRMVPHPEGFAIPALSPLELKPGGKHIMLIDLVKPLVAGETIELTLTFEKAADRKVVVEVREG